MRLAHSMVATFATLAAIAFVPIAEGREVAHAMGVTEIPDNPQRVVILTNEGTEALVHLGVIPVGAAQSWDGDPWYEHLAEPLANTVSLGTETGINLEQVAALEPDLIIGTKVRQEKIYEQLSAIAPTVFSQTIGETWLDNYQFYGEVLGLGDAAQANVEALKARAVTLRNSLGEAVNEEISLVRFSPGRNRIYYRGTFPGVVLDLVGFARPAAQDRADHSEEVQKERIADMAGDRIFFFFDDLNSDDAVANMEEWTNDPLWRGLDAVKSGRVHRVSEMMWNTGGGILCAQMMLDDIARLYGVPAP